MANIKSHNWFFFSDLLIIAAVLLLWAPQPNEGCCSGHLSENGSCIFSADELQKVVTPLPFTPCDCGCGAGSPYPETANDPIDCSRFHPRIDTVVRTVSSMRWLNGTPKNSSHDSNLVDIVHLSPHIPTTILRI